MLIKFNYIVDRGGNFVVKTDDCRGPFFKSNQGMMIKHNAVFQFYRLLWDIHTVFSICSEFSKHDKYYINIQAVSVKGSYDRVKAQHGADVMDNEMIITVSAIVASYVAVFKAFNLVDNRFLPLIALGIAAVFVLVPSGIYDKLIQISTIGLGAAGVYQMTKRKL